MINHKWKDLLPPFEYGTKPQTCINCKIERYWFGSEYQGWRYTIYEYKKCHDGKTRIFSKDSWERPECNTIKSKP